MLSINYEDVFSTKADFILHYSAANPVDWQKPLTDEEKNYVYHAEMKSGGFDKRKSVTLSLNHP